MSDTLLLESVERAFAQCTNNLRADRKVLGGFVPLLVPEERNGFGGRWIDACDVARIAGRAISGYALMDDILLARQNATDSWDADQVTEIFGAVRAAQMAGAMQAALDLSVEYVRGRQQFGKPLASFQAIQQQLAVFAEETAATSMAAAAAFHALDARGGRAPFECGAAKLRANMAVTVATSVAHQVHGAMGFTAEYKLQRYTRALWRWRSESGNDRYWAQKLGTAVAARGAGGFWAGLAAPATIHA